MTNAVVPLYVAMSLEGLRSLAANNLAEVEERADSLDGALRILENAKRDEDRGHQEWAYILYMQCAESICLDGQTGGPMNVAMEAMKKRSEEKIAYLGIILDVRYKLREYSDHSIIDATNYVKSIAREYHVALQRNIKVGTKLIEYGDQLQNLFGNFPDHLEVNGKQVDLSTCSICYGVPATRIFQCHEGHILCEMCSEHQLAQCPICRKPYGETGKSRNRELENLLKSLFQACNIADRETLERNQNILKQRIERLQLQWDRTTKDVAVWKLKYDVIRRESLWTLTAMSNAIDADERKQQRTQELVFRHNGTT